MLFGLNSGLFDLNSGLFGLTNLFGDITTHLAAVPDGSAFLLYNFLTTRLWVISRLYSREQVVFGILDFLSFLFLFLLLIFARYKFDLASWASIVLALFDITRLAGFFVLIQRLDLFLFFFGMELVFVANWSGRSRRG